MKKPLDLSLWVLLALASTCWAQDGTKTYTETLGLSHTESGPSTNSFFHNPHFTIMDTIASRYWGSIVGGIFYSGGPVNFTDFKLTLDDPVGTTYAFVGMINPLDTVKYDYQGGTEYYAAIGKTIDLWRGGSHNLPLASVNLMVLYDAISKINRGDDDVVQQYARIELPRVPFILPYAEGYHWFKTGTKAPPVGYFVRTGVHRQQPLGLTFQKSEMELGIDLSAGWSSEELFGTSEGLAYHRAVISTVFKFNDHFKIIPSIVGQLPGQQDKNRAFVDRPRLFYNLTLQYDF